MTGSVHWCCLLFFLLGQLAKSSSPAHTWEHWHAQKQIISFDWARGLDFTILVVPCCFLFLSVQAQNCPGYEISQAISEGIQVLLFGKRHLVWTKIVLICKWHRRTATSPQENIVSMDFASYKVVIGATGIKLNAISRKHKDWLVFFFILQKKHSYLQKIQYLQLYK